MQRQQENDLNRFGNGVAPELARKNIAIIGVMPGLTAPESRTQVERQKI